MALRTGGVCYFCRAEGVSTRTIIRDKSSTLAATSLPRFRDNGDAHSHMIMDLARQRL